MFSDEPTPSVDTGKPLVAVVAADGPDRGRVTGMVAMLGYEAQGFNSAEDFERSERHARAVIVCFRVAMARAPVPAIPRPARPCRILVLSDLDSEQHIIDTLDSGAHQIFHLDEAPRILNARLEAALRRHDPILGGSMSVAPFRFELAHRRVTLDGKLVDLSPKEFDLAFYLFSNRGRVVTNAELLTSVWSLPQDIDTRRIDTAACRVRKKMSLGEHTGWVLRRFRREGYGLYWDSRDAAVELPEAVERRDQSSQADDEAFDDVELDTSSL